MVGCTMLGGRRTNDDVSTETLEITHLFHRDLVSEDENAAVTTNSRNKCKADTSISRCGLNDRPAGFEHSFLLGPVDHRDTNAILDRIAWVEALHLGKNLRLYIVLPGQMVDTN